MTPIRNGYVPPPPLFVSSVPVFDTVTHGLDRSHTKGSAVSSRENLVKPGTP
jgi:hypothetical protein